MLGSQAIQPVVSGGGEPARDVRCSDAESDPSSVEEGCEWVRGSIPWRGDLQSCTHKVLRRASGSLMLTSQELRLLLRTVVSVRLMHV